MTHSSHPAGTSRRAFLQRASALSLAAGAAPWALNLAAMGEAAAQGASDYKALVCVFLYGGNDHANTVVPYDTASYQAYAGYRSGIALPRAALDATVLAPTTPLPDGRAYALAPSLAPLRPLFDAGRMAVVLNVGPLCAPTSKAQFQARSVPLPPGVFSHSDQQYYWHTSLPPGAGSGWGGRIGDLFAAGNGQSAFTCISAAGNAVYLSGRNAVQYQVSPTGAVPVDGLKAPLFGSAACSEALRGLLMNPRGHMFESDYVDVTRRSVESADLIAAALGGTHVSTPFPANSSLASQLSVVARTIAARASLGVRRQVFFVSLGGFDTHDGLMDIHPTLLTHVGGALAAFYRATEELGVAHQVTTFTASDFGRTLVSNGDGTDHGWGGMQFVLGGAVRGRSYVGRAPVVAVDGPDDVGQGRLLPGIALDQFAATLAGWFGASASQQLDILPNLGRFSGHDLGFMAPS